MRNFLRFLTILCASYSFVAYAADAETPSCPGGQCAAPGGACASGQCAAPGGGCASGQCPAPGSSCASGQCPAPGSSCASGQCAAPGGGCSSMYKIEELIYYDDDSGQTPAKVIIKLNNGLKLISSWEVDWFYRGQTVGVYNYSSCHLTLVTYDRQGHVMKQFEFHKYPDSHVYLWP